MKNQVTMMISVLALAWQAVEAQPELIVPDLGQDSHCLNGSNESDSWENCSFKSNFTGHDEISDRARDVVTPQKASEAQNANRKVPQDLSRFEEGSSLEMARSAAAKLPIPSSVINDAVRSYEASSEDVLYMTLPDGRYVNRVFGGIDLREPELEVLESFLVWVETNELILPPGFADEHNFALRYLDSTAPDFRKAYDSILDMDEWLRSEIVPSFQKAAKGELPSRFLETGMIYGMGRDREQRPIIVMNIRKIIDNNPTVDELLATSDFVTSYTIFNAMPAGRVEQEMFVLDVKNVALYEIPVKKIATVMARNTKFYKHRMAASYIVNMGWVLKTLVDVFQGFMDPFQVQKTKFFGSDFSDMTKQLGAENLEQKYGGKLPNRVEDFFPPNYHS